MSGWDKNNHKVNAKFRYDICTEKEQEATCQMCSRGIRKKMKLETLLTETWEQEARTAYLNVQAAKSW